MPIKVLGYGSCRGIDLERFDITSKVMGQAAQLRKDDICTFITVGGVVGDKGNNELVEAFVKLNEENNDTRLLLVGCYENNLDPFKS